ncbi:MAG: alcohol dehydrogenase catalytic domain-containing protein [Candidatus Eisenbacteria bacterium]|nr:alcohol dehydrogenase catalytic domain-containing protein [Candidatus Eisenbacteria bacterium]
MKAVCWQGTRDVRVETVPDPKILNPRDAVVEVTSTAISGLDLHMYDGAMPAMEPGTILGHEFMGKVVETGREVKEVKTGDRVVVAFPIACGACWFCRHELWALCDNTNPEAELAEAAFGYAPAGVFGSSRLMGGYAGGQAEYVRVPFADIGALKIEDDGLADEQALFLSDILPAGWMAAEECGIAEGDTVAVWGCGPVGQFALRSATLLGAGRTIAIDEVGVRLKLAADQGAQSMERNGHDVVEVLKLLTGGRGPDACIDAVGMEAHGNGLAAMYERAKQRIIPETDRPQVLREAIQACRKGGTLSLAGTYSGLADKIPLGAAFSKGLTLRMGPTHVQRYMRPLLQRIQQGEIDPQVIISHRLTLDEAPRAYRILRDREEGCTKVVMRTKAGG